MNWPQPYSKDGIDVCVEGDYAYREDSDEGMYIMDIVDPYSNLEIVGSLYTPGSALGVFINENFAYVADGPEGLQVVNVSDPEIPLIITFYKLKDVAYDMHVRGKYAYVAYGESGLWIFSLQPEIEENEAPSWFWLPLCAPPPYTLYPYQFYWPNQVMNYARYLVLEQYHQGHYLKNLSYYIQPSISSLYSLNHAPPISVVFQLTGISGILVE